MTKELTLDEWQSVLEGIFSFPDFPQGEGVAAYMACYFEPYGGSGVDFLLVLPCCVCSSSLLLWGLRACFGVACVFSWGPPFYQRS